MTPVLAQMNPAHLKRVVEIETAVFSDPWKPRDFELARNRNNSFCRVVLVERTVAGYVVGLGMDREFHLENFAIAPRFQHKGLGQKALKAAFDLLDKRTRVVSLEVRISNRVAIAFYKKMGFETMAIRKAYYTYPIEDALVMLKPLKTRLSDWVSHVFQSEQKRLSLDRHNFGDG